MVYIIFLVIFGSGSCLEQHQTGLFLKIIYSAIVYPVSRLEHSAAAAGSNDDGNVVWWSLIRVLICCRYSLQMMMGKSCLRERYPWCQRGTPH